MNVMSEGKLSTLTVELINVSGYQASVCSNNSRLHGFSSAWDGRLDGALYSVKFVIRGILIATALFK